MAQVKMEFIDEGFIEILNTQELDNVCFEAAWQIAYHNGKSHWTADHWYSHAIGKMKGGRVAAIVSGDKAGDLAEAETKALSRAVSACRV